MASTNSHAPVALVTGGARGIGLACGRWFLAHGYCVALVDNDADTLARTDTALADPRGCLPARQMCQTRSRWIELWRLLWRGSVVLMHWSTTLGLRSSRELKTPLGPTGVM